MVGLELPGLQSGFEGLAFDEEVPDGIGLVAVGDYQLSANLTDGMIDDEAGIHHLGGIVGLGADAVLGDGKDAVAGIFAAAHDEIGDDSGLAVSAAAQNDASAGVGIAFQGLGEVQFVHVRLSLF